MKIIGISGSPRKGGNSDTILEDTLKWGEAQYGIDTEIVYLRDSVMKQCLACGNCGKDKITGEYNDCVLKDKDDIVDVFNTLEEANGFIISTPVYFGLPTPLVITFLNRSRFMRHQDFRLDLKVFGVISIAGRRTGGNETTIFATWYPLIRNGCIPVGNGDKTCQFGAVGWANKPGEIREDLWAYEQSQDMLTRIYQVSSLLELGKDSFEYTPMRFSYDSGNR